MARNFFRSAKNQTHQGQPPLQKNGGAHRPRHVQAKNITESTLPSCSWNLAAAAFPFSVSCLIRVKQQQDDDDHDEDHHCAISQDSATHRCTSFASPVRSVSRSFHHTIWDNGGTCYMTNFLSFHRASVPASSRGRPQSRDRHSNVMVRVSKTPWPPLRCPECRHTR